MSGCRLGGSLTDIYLSIALIVTSARHEQGRHFAPPLRALRSGMRVRRCRAFSARFAARLLSLSRRTRARLGASRRFGLRDNIAVGLMVRGTAFALLSRRVAALLALTAVGDGFGFNSRIRLKTGDFDHRQFALDDALDTG